MKYTNKKGIGHLILTRILFIIVFLIILKDVY